MLGGLAAAALIASIGPAAPVGEATSDRLIVARGFVIDEGDEGGDWFAFEEPERRFRLPPASNADHLAFYDLIGAADERRVPLRIRYDATAGEAGAGLAYVVYPVCSMGISDAEPIGDEAANCPPSSASGGGATARLALGVGIAWDRPEAGRALLTEALTADGLPAHLRALGLRVRGRTAEQLARRHQPASSEHDRLIADALADYRSWLAIAPDDADAPLAVARALVGLGGYDEGIAVLEAFGRVQPDYEFPALIKIAGLYRRRGDHRRALRLLDDFAARDGFEEGMRFHYHRAWTLMMLGRNREAVDAVSRGLRFQRDYPWAYLLRSCAAARLGWLSEALADQEHAYSLLTHLPASDDPVLAEDIARSRALAVTLHAAVDAGRSWPLPAGCEGFWDREPPPRPRSPLLDAAASPAPTRPQQR